MKKESRLISRSYKKTLLIRIKNVFVAPCSAADIPPLFYFKLFIFYLLYSFKYLHILHLYLFRFFYNIFCGFGSIESRSILCTEDSSVMINSNQDPDADPA